MAQLDRFLNLLVTNKATALLLSEGDIATLTIKDTPRPVMKQSLTSAQILTLVREIAPQGQPHQLDAQGSARFHYTTADGTFEVSLMQNGKISARIEPLPAGAVKPSPSLTPPAGFTPTVASSPVAAAAAQPFAAEARPASVNAPSANPAPAS